MSSSKFHTLPDWDKPKDGLFYIRVNAWWCVDEQGNPLFYGKNHSAICNSDEHTAKAISAQLNEGHQVKQLPVVYIPEKY